MNDIAMQEISIICKGTDTMIIVSSILHEVLIWVSALKTWNMISDFQSILYLKVKPKWFLLFDVNMFLARCIESLTWLLIIICAHYYLQISVMSYMLLNSNLCWLASLQQHHNIGLRGGSMHEKSPYYILGKWFFSLIFGNLGLFARDMGHRLLKWQ